MPMAYSYVRFSSSEQKKGDSLRRQTEMSEKYAMENNLTLDRSLHLMDLGLSAFTGANIERGALGGFLKAIELGKIEPGSYLLVESLDRLSREDVLTAFNTFQSIVNNDIVIVTLSDNMIYSKESIIGNFASLIVSIVYMARAHDESAIKSVRKKASWEGKRKKIHDEKLTAKCPHWMKLDSTKKNFELIPERVEVVEKIINWTLNGIGQTSIVKMLNSQSTPTFTSYGKGWHGSYIHKMLNSPALYGDYQAHTGTGKSLTPVGDPVPNYYPALITKDKFNLIQSVRRERRSTSVRAKKGTDVPNLFSGIIKCGYCGNTMNLLGGSAKKDIRKGGRIHTRPGRKYLVCNHGRRGLDCYAVQWAYVDFEKSFLTFCRSIDLKEFFFNIEKENSIRTRELTLNEKIKSKNAELFEKQKKLKNLIEIIEGGEAPKTLVSRILEVEVQISDIQKEIELMKVEIKTNSLSLKNRNEEIESISLIIDKLSALDANEKFEVRAALSQKIKHSVESITLFPAGHLTSSEEIDDIRIKLSEIYDPEKIDEYIKNHYRIEPKRVGDSAKARYEIDGSTGRCFTIKAKNGGFRVVTPNFDDPANFKIDIGHEDGSDSFHVNL